jgi:predicted Zn finger-like uncharacterized protein
VFRITAEQLALREGQVRCGRCRAVFDANDHLVAEERVEVTAPPAAERESEPAQAASDEAPIVEASTEASIVEASTEASIVEASTEASIVEASIVEAPQAERADVEPAIGEAPKTHEPASDTPAVETPAESADVATPVESAVAETPAESADAATPAGPADAETPAEPADAETPAESADAETTAEPVPAETVLTDTVAVALPAVERPPRYEWNPRKPVRERPALYAAAALLLVVALALQLVLEYRDRLAAQAPFTRPILASACSLLGCTIAPLHDAAALSIDASDLQADPAHRGLLQLSATIRNRAAYAIAYPYLELTLTDASDQIVARRALAPGEYVGGTANPNAGIPGNGESLVRLFIDASATTQAGYRLYLFYP